MSLYGTSLNCQTFYSLELSGKITSVRDFMYKVVGLWANFFSWPTWKYFWSWLHYGERKVLSSCVYTAFTQTGMFSILLLMISSLIVEGSHWGHHFLPINFSVFLICTEGERFSKNLLDFLSQTGTLEVSSPVDWEKTEFLVYVMWDSSCWT